MKPHRLTIEAIGPYPDTVEVEFDDLAAEGLFLIHGPTGAGKTFLLDAMSFALYGKVPGERGEHTLQSDHADRTAKPRVTLEFSAQGDRYRVERVPKHTAAKQRGVGETTRNSSVSLVRLDGVTEVPIASAVGEVAREVQDLVGLDASQFQQVILLPQGRFEQVLRAGSDDRERLLKTLFDTVLYERVAAWLDEHAKSARAEVSAQQHTLDTLRAQAEHQWAPFADDGTPDEEPDETDDEPGEAPTEGADEAHEGPGPTDQARLDQLVAQITVVVDAASTAVRAAETEKAAALTAKAEVEAIAARWARRAAARARITELDAQRSAIDLDRQALERAERAEQLRGSLDTATAFRDALALLRAEVDRDLEDADAARASAVALPAPVTELDLSALPPQPVITAALASLAAHRTTLEDLVRKAADATIHSTEAEAQRAEEAAQLAARTTSTDALESLRKDRETITTELAVARTARDQLAGLEQASAAATRRADAAAALVSARKDRDKADTTSTKAQKDLDTAQKRARDLRTRYLEGIAATLAGELVAGKPCIVCGSTEHPVPAVAGTDAVAKDDVDAADVALDDATKRATAATNAARQTAEKVVELEAVAGDAADDTTAAAAAATAASTALEGARQRAESVDLLETRAKDIDREIASNEKAVVAADKAAAAAGTAATTASTQAEKLQREVVTVLGEGVAPDAALATLDPIDAALTNLAERTEHIATAQAELTTAEKHLAREIEDSPFADTDEAHAALRDEATRAQLAQRTTEFDQDVTKQRGILEAPDLADLPDEAPDTAAADAAAVIADARHVEAIQHSTRASGARTELERLAREHRLGDEALAVRRTQAELTNAVANRCAGRTAPKVSLQRWVLAAYLDEICTHANSRLGKMTSGRYQMRVFDGQKSGGGQAGLELRVLDAFTGDEREVQSLSGGETFQASLALALGVADAVQAHTGGVRLDALFIDEGFGTLDPDSLQLAMDELDRLREGGRMVGIISHVSALRERIRAGIEVIPTDHGSTVRVGATTMP